MNAFQVEDSSQTLIITYCTWNHVPEDQKFHRNRSESIRSPTHVFFHHVSCGLRRHLCDFDLKLILCSDAKSGENSDVLYTVYAWSLKLPTVCETILFFIVGSLSVVWGCRQEPALIFGFNANHCGGGSRCALTQDVLVLSRLDKDIPQLIFLQQQQKTRQVSAQKSGWRTASGDGVKAKVGWGDWTDWHACRSEWHLSILTGNLWWNLINFVL